MTKLQLQLIYFFRYFVIIIIVSHYKTRAFIEHVYTCAYDNQLANWRA